MIDKMYKTLGKCILKHKISMLLDYTSFSSLKPSMSLQHFIILRMFVNVCVICVWFTDFVNAIMYRTCVP